MAGAARLGPFEVHAPLARGGMGEVWRGRHVGSGVRVAIKVLTEDATRLEEYLTFFRNEVRAIAGLDHPAIIHVFDHGTVNPAAEAATRGRMAAGSPWLAMEMAVTDLAVQVGRPCPWSELRDILLTLLDALAHAHAHGVIHRDLKPPNALWFKGGSLKLTDFGIAHAVGEITRSRLVGTPQYMSPEQLTARWRDYGPWTDLYALGVMAWQLACGRLPFQAQSGPALRRAHLMEDPDPIRPLAPVPDGFEGWILTLMEKHPSHRYQRAADAAWALRSLPEPDEEAPFYHRDESVPVANYATFSFSGTSMDDTIEGPELDPLPPPMDSPATAPLARVVVPATWTLPDLPQPTPQLRDTGLGLWGLRAPQFVGRIRERNLLWTVLRQATNQAPRLVLVHGDAGVGKSRLLHWLARRSHEVGVAHVLQTTHEVQQSEDALAATMALDLNAQRLEPGPLDDRLRSELPDWPDAARTAMSAWLQGKLPDRALRIGILDRFIRHRAAQRTVMWIFEDIHWASATLDLLANLLTRWSADPVPVLFCLSTRDEELAQHADAAAQLRRLLGSSVARRMKLGPLETQETTSLIDGLLGLESSVAAQVQAHCGGNPLFITALIGDWVDRGVLERGVGGFRLAAGEELRLPDSLLQAARARLDAIFDLLPDESRFFLERAAVLGNEVDEEEWQAACDVELTGRRFEQGSAIRFSPTRARTRARLVNDLLARGLAVETELGFAFVNRALRDALEQGAEQAGRIQTHHLACAAILQEEAEDQSERVGLHMLAAGRADEAADMLLHALRVDRDHRGRLRVMGALERALEHIPEADPRWGELFVQQAQTSLADGDSQEGMRWANRAVLSARRHTWSEVLPSALLQKASAAWQRGDADLCDTLSDEALRRGADDPTHRGRCLRLMARSAGAAGEPDRALELLDEARNAYREAGRPTGEAACLMARIRWADDSETDQNIQDALKIYQEAGSTRNEAACHNAMGEAARRAGALHRAEAEYRRAISLYEALGTGGMAALVPQVNLAMVHACRGDGESARTLASACRNEATRLHRPKVIAIANSVLMLASELLDEATEWEVALAGLSRALRQLPRPNKDIASTLLTAAQLAQAAEAPQRAQLAAELARSQFEALGDEAGHDAALRLYDETET